MKTQLHSDIYQALHQAATHNIKVNEIWLGPEQFKTLLDSGALDTKEENGQIRHFWYSFRVRQMVDPGVRAGKTTCQFGPGVT